MEGRSGVAAGVAVVKDDTAGGRRKRWRVFDAPLRGEIRPLPSCRRGPRSSPPAPLLVSLLSASEARLRSSASSDSPDVAARCVDGAAVVLLRDSISSFRHAMNSCGVRGQLDEADLALRQLVRLSCEAKEWADTAGSDVSASAFVAAVHTSRAGR